MSDGRKEFSSHPFFSGKSIREQAAELKANGSPAPDCSVTHGTTLRSRLHGECTAVGDHQYNPKKKVRVQASYNQFAKTQFLPWADFEKPQNRGDCAAEG